MFDRVFVIPPGSFPRSVFVRVSLPSASAVGPDFRKKPVAPFILPNSVRVVNTSFSC